MNILWCSWKDIQHPKAGGAETVSYEIMKRLVAEGNNVKLLTARYDKSTDTDNLEGIDVIRRGNGLTVYLHAFLYYRKNLKDWPSVVIDEMNTIPFFSGLYSKKPSMLVYYQLARSVWFYQMIFPFSVVGYVLEALYLRLMRHIYRQALTESESSRRDLSRYGFSPDNINLFRVGTHLAPLDKLPQKSSQNNILVLGAIRPMKQTLDAVKAFELARDKAPALTLKIAGDNTGSYAKKVLAYVSRSRHSAAIEVLGRVSAKERINLMQQATLVVVTSVKEGWCLVVTEANGQGTPAITYDTDGLRDSVQDGTTGILCAPGDISMLGETIQSLASNKEQYTTLRKNAWQSSKQYTFDNSYLDFKKALQKVL